MRERAISVIVWGGMGSPATRKAPRTRVAGESRDSKCRSLAPAAAASLIKDSKSMLINVY
jgi:hypothetical protein